MCTAAGCWQRRFYLCVCRHSLHAIASQVSPVPGCTGIELLEAETFNLHCFQTLTGTKFLLVVEPNTPYIPALLQRWVHSRTLLTHYSCVTVIHCGLPALTAQDIRAVLRLRAQKPVLRG